MHRSVIPEAGSFQVYRQTLSLFVLSEKNIIKPIAEGPIKTAACGHGIGDARCSQNDFNGLGSIEGMLMGLS